MGRQAKLKRIAILTGGGDCPGLNAVIRSVTRSAIIDHGWEVWGIEDGFEGLIEGRFVRLTLDSVAGIISQGGTILGTTNRMELLQSQKKFQQAKKFFRKNGFEALVCVGGEGTLTFARKFARMGVPIVGIPKTIDNDVPGTERTVGFYSALHIATKAIDHLHTTAASHHRVMIVEVMGRHAGWIALASGIAGGADIVLIPEVPFDLKKVCERVKLRSARGRRFTIMVIAEGIAPERKGAVGQWLAQKIETTTGLEARAVTLGHLLRSGGPIYQDRLLATTLGWHAVEQIAKKKTGVMIAWGKGEFFPLPFAKMKNGSRLVPKTHPWLAIARSMGTMFASKF